MKAIPIIGRRSVTLSGAVASTALLLLAGCSSGTGSGSAAAAAGAVSVDPAYSLTADCPGTITIQTGWDPAVGNDYELYELAGPDGKVDSGQKSYTADLIAHGHDTGVKLKLLVGGAVKSYQSGGQLIRESNDILLADDGLDTNILQSAKTPMVDIFAPQLHNALGVLWDRGKHSAWNTIADIGGANGTILVSANSNLPWQYLQTKGVIKSAELDKSYKGAPALFVAAGGAKAQQGYATNEPYLFEHVITQWMKPVAFQKVSDYGYDPYANALGTLPENVTKYASCFKKLVPMMQQASLDYLADPKAANDLIVKLVKAYNDGFVYSADQATWAAGALKSSQVVGNSADGTFGSFDPAKVSAFFDLLTPLLATDNITVKAGLKPTDLYTNEFIDPSIKLS
jgi:hypothetical protein